MKNKNQIDDRLPPGQVLTQNFPALQYEPIPTFNPAKWNLHIWGEVEKEIWWNWEELKQLPHCQVNLDIHCVTTWSKLDTLWGGISLGTLVKEGYIKLLPDAHFVIQHAESGFTTNIPLEVALADNFLLATTYGSEPLAPEHGHPLRGVVGAIPGRTDLFVPYLYKGAKWLRGLEFAKEDIPGFWEKAGYHNHAEVWKEERFDE